MRNMGRIVCDVCVEENASEIDVVPAAMVYCLDCRQKLCRPCSRPHKMWSGGPHQLREMADVEKTEDLQQRRSRCEKHEFNFIELYCFDCKVNLCMKCFAVGHTRHQCGEAEQVAGEFSKHIDADVKQVRQRLCEFTAAVAKAEERSTNFCADVKKVENEVAEMAERLKRLIDKHVDEVQQQVRELKAVTVKDIDAQKDSLSLAMVALDSYACLLYTSPSPRD